MTGVPENDRPIETGTTPRTRSTQAWGQLALKQRKNGILDPRSSKPPANIKILKEWCARSQGSPSPTQSEFQDYEWDVAQAVNESTMQSVLVGQLLKKHCRTPQVVAAFNKRCVLFPQKAGFNNGLTILQPDFVQGLAIQEFGDFPVNEYIDGSVLHEATYPITLAHIAGEFKALGMNLEHAKLQAAHGGASLVYARNQALKYLGEEEPSSNAEVITFTTDGSILKLYAHYASREEDGTDKYHQYHFQSYFLNFNDTGLKEGRRALRNAQEYAMEQSCLLRDRLIEHWEKDCLVRDQLREQWEKSKADCEPVEQPHESPLMNPPTKPPHPGRPNPKRRVRQQKAPLSTRSGRISKRGAVEPPQRRSARLSKALSRMNSLQDLEN